MQPWWNPQQPSPMHYFRYRSAFDRVGVPAIERSWPDRRLTAAPLWVPVDLRDGNQALVEPMDPDRKFVLFSLLVEMGFKEIEIGYPSASQADFDFARRLCLYSEMPDDVTISAFTPARPELIDRTFEAMKGVKNGMIHLCMATAPTWRSLVYGVSRAEVLDMILKAAEQVLLRADTVGDNVRFEFSPEVFNLTEPDYILEVCNAITERWDASDDRPVVHNLPATVEVATPNVFADQIEYVHRNLARRDQVILSVHPHNDRGTGVAAAELAVLAGAQRVEGCLFGNGERTGNVDLVTLALNLCTQGVDPMIDLTAIDEVRRTVEYCTRIPVHPRHPYSGDLVYTAFSGGHQDAIRKGLDQMNAEGKALPPWDIPYLPIDPADVGRTYEAVIRVNSQSGKGGIAYLLESRHGFRLPRPLQIDFSGIVQAATDSSGAELTADELWELFVGEYRPNSEVSYCSVRSGHRGEQWVMSAEISIDSAPMPASGHGPSLVAAASDLLSRCGVDIDILSGEQQELAGPDGLGHACFVKGRTGGAIAWGAGFAENPDEAALQAVISAAARSGVFARLSTAGA